MSSNVQSVVCCLGDPVAGNPTQFLMQRAAQSLGLDWTFVTSEVTLDKLASAFQGIRDLGFSGVAFLPPHRAAACSLVDSVTESALRSGAVRVARRDGNSWLGDDTLGAAIVECLRSDSQLSASTNGCILVSGREWLAHLIRLAGPQGWQPRICGLVADTEEDIQKMEMIDVLIVDAESKPLPTKLLSQLRWTARPTVVFVEPNKAWEAAVAKLQLQNVKYIRTMDIVAAKAVVSFNFWTGCHIELSLMRDALDEYCQW